MSKVSIGATADGPAHQSRPVVEPERLQSRQAEWPSRWARPPPRRAGGAARVERRLPKARTCQGRRPRRGSRSSLRQSPTRRASSRVAVVARGRRASANASDGLRRQRQRLALAARRRGDEVAQPLWASCGQRPSSDGDWPPAQCFRRCGRSSPSGRPARQRQRVDPRRRAGAWRRGWRSRRRPGCCRTRRRRCR